MQVRGNHDTKTKLAITRELKAPETSQTMATIFQLGPERPLECPPDATALLAAQMMSQSRVHCLMVMDRKLVGIVTAKDMAYRLTAQGLDPQDTLVSQIMTRTPLCLHMDTPITDALATMVDRSVRHLPLVDSQGAITGVLDITRCFHQAMLRLERIATSAQRLRSVLRDVVNDYGDVRTREAERIVQDVGALGDLIDVPTLESVGCKPAVYVESSCTVLAAAKMMVKHATTALLVLDGTAQSTKVIGIFTSKDVCTRVVARGYDPQTCTVARVLTTSPEFALESLPVSAALRLMYQGHFLSLPVMNDQGSIVGVVSVLQLTYAALSQLGKRDGFRSLEKTTLAEVSSRLTDDASWDKFWSSLDKSNDDIHSLESSVSKPPSRSHTPSQSSSRRTSLNLISNSRRSSLTKTQSEETINAPRPRLPSSESISRMSFYMKRKTVVFRITEHTSGAVDKICMTLTDNISVMDDVKPFTLLMKEVTHKFGPGQDVFYSDEEGDYISVTSEDDLMHAITTAEKNGDPAVELLLKPVGYNDGILASLWRMFTALTTKFPKLTSQGIFTGVAVLSLGVLLGSTFRRR